jgi:CMP-N,N'-diacetyllegionaminic acid synthase
VRILAVVPARGGSKRLPGKNVRSLGGKPLIVWSIDAAREVPAICDVLVSTDDSRIAEIAVGARALVPWLRPAELATDTARSSDVAIHALDWYQTNRGTVDGLLLLQPTSPFRSAATIARGIDEFAANGGQAVVAVSPAASHPRLMYTIAAGALVPFMPEHDREVRSQDLSPFYVVNGALYLVSPAELERTRSIFGASAKALVIDSDFETLDIDTDFDWRIAECMLGSMERPTAE